jgi:hypothetical protein
MFLLLSSSAEESLPPFSYQRHQHQGSTIFSVPTFVQKLYQKAVPGSVTVSSSLPEAVVVLCLTNAINFVRRPS